MRKIVLAAMLAAAAPAYAQQPAFTPFTFTAQMNDALQHYLMEQPYKFSRPVMDFIANQEAQARHEAETAKSIDAAKKAAEPPKKP